MLEHTALLALGGVATTAAFAGLLSVFAPLSNPWLEGAAGVVFYVGLFFAVLTWIERYSAADWTVPAGVEDSNWALRRKVSIVLGVGAVVITAVSSTLWIRDPVARALMNAQSVVMAVSAANDFRRFRLPLPLTVTGLLIAIVLLAIGPYAWPIVVLALVWAVALSLVHRFVAKSGMSLGDQIALLWIALAAPFNGLLAVFIGQLTLDILARITDWKAKKKRVPIGGAWLICAAALLAVPQWPAWVMTASASAPVLADYESAPGRPISNDALFRSGRMTDDGLAQLRGIAQEAAYVTGRLSFEEDRQTRVRLARVAAQRVRELRVAAMQANVPSTAKAPLSGLLGELASALETYDIDAVRRSSSALSERRRAIEALIQDYASWKEFAAESPQP